MKQNIITAFVAAAALSSFAAIQGTITTENGDTQKGEIRWSARDKAYVVAHGGVEVQVKAADVAELDIAKPAGYDQAVAQVEKGQGNAALPVLVKIVKEYQHLQWDKTAGGYLARAYLDAGKGDAALKACQDIISADPTAAYKGELAPAYWSALLQVGQNAKLESALAKAAASGDRFASGAALTMRGDIIFKAGNESADAARKALSDGYLRVVLLYKDAPVAKKLQPEALYKAAKCFEKLGQSARADAMRTDLKRNYGDSPWATK